MRQTILNASAITEGSNVNGRIEWSGGDGLLKITGLNILSGSPVIDISVDLDGFDISSSTGLPNTVNSVSSYKFWAPAGAFIQLSIGLEAGEELTVGDCWAYTTY